MSNRAERCYRILLGLLPVSLRRGFEDEMVHDFLRRLEGARSYPEKVGVWGSASMDLLVETVRELIGGWRLRKSRSGGSGGWGPLGSFGKDLRNGVRTLRRSPSFTLLAVLTLALGIGGATVSFSLVKGVLLRPLPYPADHELVVLRQLNPEGREETLSFPNFDDFRTQAESFSGIAAVRFASTVSILGGTEPARGTVVPVSREFFSVLGVMPFLGRPILPAENRPGGDAVAVVSHEYWTRYLDSVDRLSDLRLNIEGTSFQVVGVMPPGFEVLEEADVFLPLERNAFKERSSSNYRGIGRLASGATLAQARTELNGIAARILSAYSEEARLSGVSLKTLREETLGSLTRPLFLLLGASGLLLLLACSNVASTLLARSVRREREMAIRTALGGGRRRLVQLVFSESLLLAALSGLTGVGLTLATLKILESTGQELIPRMASVAVDGPVLGFSLGLTLLTSLLFGLLPALRLPEPASGLRSGSGGSTRKTGKLGWNVLVGGQVGLAVSLVVASGLLLRSMGEILSAETNFRSEGVLAIGLDFSTDQATTLWERWANLTELKNELKSLPGVGEVGYVSYLPQSSGMMSGTVYRPPLPVEGLPEHFVGDVGWRIVDEDYFRAMGISLLRGRFFTREDLPDSPPVVILNEPLERVLFSGEDAIGSPVGFDPFWRDTDLRVVGVVAGARDWRVPEGEQLEAYVFVGQRADYARVMTAVVHSEGDPADLFPPVRERLRAVVPTVPGTLRTLDSLLADSFRDRTFTLGVLGVFAGLALLLSAVGIYGVVSYTVSSQAREIGILLALGAERGRVRTGIFFRSLRGVLAGVAGGIGVAILFAGILESLLFEVEPRDPLTLTVAPLVLLVAASVAIVIPVVKHTRIDPVHAMRME